MENEKLLDLEELDMPEDELFSFIDNSTLDSEKITAPRYSYWHSVFRVFFRKKINIVILAVLAVILLFTKIASWKTMVSVFVGGAVMSLIFNMIGTTVAMCVSPLDQLFLGGFAFGAVFMATDPVTSARTETGKYIYGFLVGAMSMLVSNMFFSQGPWTPWQMFAFGIAGFIFGLLSGKGPVKAEAGLPSGFSGGRSLKKILQRLPVSLFGFLVIVVIVGPILDTCTLFTMTTAVSGASAATVYLAGLPVNLIHGAAVFVTLFFLTVPIMDKLDRIKIKYGMMEKQDKVR